MADLCLQVLEQLRYVKGAVDVEISKTSFVDQIKRQGHYIQQQVADGICCRERTQLRQFWNSCGLEARRACPNHGKSIY